MSLLRRLKAFTNQRWLQSTFAVISGGKDAKRPDFDYRAAVMAYRSWVYAAANLNAVAVASVPLRLYVRADNGGAKLWNTRRPSRRQKAYLAGAAEQRPGQYARRKAAEFGDDYEVVEDSHPILELLSKVNPYQNGYDATVLRVLFTELTGNAYLHPVIDQTLGIPVELWPMQSQFVEIVPGQKESANFIEGYLYGVKQDQKQLFKPEEVIHFKRPNPANLYYGIGKVEAAWGAVMANAALHEMDLSFFENKGRPDWLLSIKGEASPDEIERFEAQIDEKLRGTKRTGRFLTATADIDVKPLSFPPKDLTGRDEIVEEIAAVFGVPVSMLKANDPNLASATTGFAQWKETTILPMLRMDEETLNQSLLPLFGIEGDAFLAYDNPVMEDERFALESRRAAVAGGWRTANEARMEEGRESIDDPMADRLLINGQPLGSSSPIPPSSVNPSASVAIQPKPNAPTPTTPEKVDAPEEMAKSALNGAQIASLVDLAKSIQLGELPKDSAVAIATSAFPTLNTTQIGSIFDPIVRQSAPATDQVAAKKLGAASLDNPTESAGGTQSAALTFEPMPEPETKDALSDCVSEKIPKLIDEGYPQDQAVAIAYSMCSEGKSFEDAIASIERDEAIREKAISDIDTKPPQSVADNARRALEVRARKPESQRGMTSVGLARARDLQNRKPLSEDTIRRMLAYFERHESDKQGETWDDQGKGWQAWNGWGGDDGWAWARRKVEQFDREREKRVGKVEKCFDKPKCGCGCASDEDATPEAWLIHLDSMDFDDCDIDGKNCGVGSEGFEQGNTCGSGEGGGGGGSSSATPAEKPASDKPKAPKAPKAGKPSKGKPPADGVTAPKEHGVKLPPNPRKMDIDTTESALRGMGYEMTAWKPSASGTTVTIRDSSGKETKLPSHEVVNLIYANSSDPKANAAPAIKPRKSADARSISQKRLWSDLHTKAAGDAEAELAAITDDEKLIARAVDKVLQGQIRSVLKELRAATAPTSELVQKVEQILAATKWDRELVAAMKPFMRASLQEGIRIGTDAIRSMASDLSAYELKSPELESYIENESVRLSRGAARGVNRYTVTRVSEILGEGVQNGETVDQLTEKVQEWAGKQGDAERSTLSRARTIARTEAMRASRAAEVEAWKSSGIVEGKTWLLAPDPCEFCEAAAKAFGEKSIGVGESFFAKGETLEGADGGTLSLDYEAVDGPPLHPNCRCSLLPKLAGDYADIQAEIDRDLEAELARIAKENP